MPASDFDFERVLPARDRWKMQWRSMSMIFDYSLAGLVSAGLLFYLTYALLRPERF
jgi:K+-transporting ATPase KdpF subunit